MKRLLLAIVLLACTATASAAEEDVMSLSDLLDSFGWDLATAEIEAEKLGEGFYVLFGIGGNIAVSIGEDGTLVVDDQFPELIPRIEAAIAKLGGNGIDFAINTHWHFDHAEGNLALGPGGTRLISQANSRAMMAESNLINLTVARYRQQAYPLDALPEITYDDRMSLHFNGERIDLIHSGPAHTTGDTAVIFRGHNAVHMGDVFNNTGYPFIDADNGGEIDGMIHFCEAVLAELKPGAVVIPGHGKVSNYAAMKRYVEMLKTVRDRVSGMIDQGMNLEEAIAAKPTADLDAIYGDADSSLGFVDRVYTSLMKKRSGL